MHRLPRTLLLFTAVAAFAPSTASAQLLISEYIEGSSFNKAIEVYNAGGLPVNLASFSLRLFSNGAAVPSASVALSGSLASGDVYVVAHASANAAILAQADLISSSVINFNGDDAVQLFNTVSATSVDVIGQIGTDPGTEWVGGGVSTLNMTIRRKVGICGGDPDGSNAFDPSIEWNGFANDTVDGLGSHFSGCSPTPTQANTWGRVKVLYR